MFLSELPQNEDYERIVAKHPFLAVPLGIGTFTTQPTSVEGLKTDLEVQDWEKVVIHKFYESRLGFVLMEHLFEKGIPDEQWIDEDTGTLQPHFEKEHHLRKLLFDYYSDSLSAKIFSTLESIGQLLFVMYSLKLNSKEKISFRLAVSKLRTANLTLHQRLHSILNGTTFKRFLEYRNNATHNYPENVIGPSVFRSGNTVYFGPGDYTPSIEVREIVMTGFYSLHLIIEEIKFAVSNKK